MTDAITNNDSRSTMVQVSEPELPFEILSGSGAVTLEPGQSREVVVQLMSQTEGSYVDVVRLLVGPDDNSRTVDIVLCGVVADRESGSVESRREATTGTVGVIYPNPTAAGTEIPVSLERPASVTVDLYDASGEMVSRPFSELLGAGTKRIPIWLKGLENGSYLIRIAVDGETVTRQVIILR